MPALARLREGVDTRLTGQYGCRRALVHIGLVYFFFLFARGFPTVAVAGYREAAGCLVGGVPRGTFTAECLVFPASLAELSTPHSRAPSLESSSNSVLDEVYRTERGVCFCLCCADRHFLERFTLVCALRPSAHHSFCYSSPDSSDPHAS